MQLVESRVQQVPMSEVIGDIDHDSARALRRAVDAALSQGSSHLLFGLASCTYLDSGGISALLDALRGVRARGWLGLVAPSPDVNRILTIVGITVDPRVRVFMTLEEARAALVISEPATEGEA